MSVARGDTDSALENAETVSIWSVVRTDVREAHLQNAPV